MSRNFLLSAAALLLLLTSRAQAAPINLLLTGDMYAPTVGPPEIFLALDSSKATPIGGQGPMSHWTLSWPTVSRIYFRA